MKRLLIAIALLLTVGQAWGFGDFPIFPTFPNFGKAVWWNNSSLTFWAPFDDPANPLTLNKGTGSLSFTRATTAMRIAIDNGYLTSTPAGTLRIEANGALIEWQRTNLALQSEALGNATNWVATTMTVDNNTAVAPDGATTTETLTASGNNATLLQSYTGTVAAYTASYYLKRKTGTGAVQVSADNTTWTSCTINASTWTRCTDTRTVTVATYYHGIRLATNTDAVYAWGGGNELGAFASSYIGPTTTAAVTRNADVLTMSASGNMSGSVGTVSFTWTPSFASTDSVLYSTIYDAGDIKSYYWSTDRKVYFTDGTDTSTTSALTFSSSTSSKFADRWTGSSAVLGSNVYLGSSSFGTNYLFGHLKSVRTWNRYFSDSEMTSISQ